MSLWILFQYLSHSSGIFFTRCWCEWEWAWLLVAGVARWIWGWLWVGMGGADGAGGGASIVWGELKHFFQIGMPIRKRARAMLIIAAGEVKGQWPLASLIWSSSLNSSLASNSPLYLVWSPWIYSCSGSRRSLPGRVILDMTFSNLSPSLSFPCKRRCLRGGGMNADQSWR